jgi:hypothetical protein
MSEHVNNVMATLALDEQVSPSEHAPTDLRVLYPGERDRRKP